MSPKKHQITDDGVAPLCRRQREDFEYHSVHVLVWLTTYLYPLTHSPWRCYIIHLLTNNYNRVFIFYLVVFLSNLTPRGAMIFSAWLISTSCSDWRRAQSKHLNQEGKTSIEHVLLLEKMISESRVVRGDLLFRPELFSSWVECWKHLVLCDEFKAESSLVGKRFSETLDLQRKSTDECRRSTA